MRTQSSSIFFLLRDQYSTRIGTSSKVFSRGFGSCQIVPSGKKSGMSASARVYSLECTEVVKSYLLSQPKLIKMKTHRFTIVTFNSHFSPPFRKKLSTIICFVWYIHWHFRKEKGAHLTFRAMHIHVSFVISSRRWVHSDRNSRSFATPVAKI